MFFRPVQRDGLEVNLLPSRIYAAGRLPRAATEPES